MRKIDEKLVGILSVGERTQALVRVYNPFQLGLIEKNFNVTHRYPFIRVVGIDCDYGDAEKLSMMREVEYVSAQGRVSALDLQERSTSSDFSTEKTDLDTAGSELSQENTQLDNRNHRNDTNKSVPGTDGNIEALITESLALSPALNGEGVTLCVMDTGVGLHSDLSVPTDRICGFTDLVNYRDYPYDDNGHGTFVAGVAAGNGLLSGGKTSGVAPKAQVYGLKVITSTGETGTFKILDGMQWLFDNFRRKKINVVCMSFGSDPLPSADPLKLGAEMLVRSGLTVVCAVGNSGDGRLKSPAVSGEVIAVGACNLKGSPAEFSSRGSYQGLYRPDVYSSGVKVKGITAGGTYSYMSGTSVAAPYVAGACCLLHQKYKRLTPYQARAAIIAASAPIRGQNVFSLG